MRYAPERESEWNDFCESSVNATYMFNREYMDYHSDQTDMFEQRFVDHSLLFYDDRDLVALLPANERNETLYSHEGLTFGGLLLAKETTTKNVIRVFESLCEYLAENDIADLRYKCIPYIYHTLPASADRYVLFRENAELYRRDISSAIPVSGTHRFPRRRRRELNTANDIGVEVRKTEELMRFWDVLRVNLEREHGVEPVHTIEEMEYLMGAFPDNIHLFGAYLNGEMISGALLYESTETARIQYLATSEKGMEVGGNEKIIDHLLNEHYTTQVSYLDFGISTEDAGRVLNEGLITFKESFDAHPFVHDFYHLKI